MKNFWSFLKMNAKEMVDGMDKFLHWAYADNLFYIFMALLITGFVSKPLGIIFIVFTAADFLTEFAERMKEFYEKEDNKE